MKKIFAVVLSLICVLQLVGCGRTMNSVINNEPNFTGVVTEITSKSNSVKYCPDCRKRITRRQAAERMRKKRTLVTQ